MIFVTIGTHEQQFNRLLKEIDRLVKENLVDDEVYIQTGYSDYIPQYCSYSKFLSYQEMENSIEKADIVITHGGPASFMRVVSKGKVPIVVPRLKKFGEHVNDHQLFFIEKVKNQGYPVIIVDDEKKIYDAINGLRKNNIAQDKYEEENSNFVESFIKVIDELGEKN